MFRELRDWKPNTPDGSWARQAADSCAVRITLTGGLLFEWGSPSCSFSPGHILHGMVFVLWTNICKQLSWDHSFHQNWWHQAGHEPWPCSHPEALAILEQALWPCTGPSQSGEENSVWQNSKMWSVILLLRVLVAWVCLIRTVELWEGVDHSLDLHVRETLWNISKWLIWGISTLHLCRSLGKVNQWKGNQQVSIKYLSRFLPFLSMDLMSQFIAGVLPCFCSCFVVFFWFFFDKIYWKRQLRATQWAYVMRTGSEVQVVLSLGEMSCHLLSSLGL